MTTLANDSKGRGSKPGERRGGRQKGTPNKRTAEFRQEIAAGGDTPLEFMLRVMRDESAEFAHRMDMAKAAAPYAHPRLATVDVGNKDGESFKLEVSWSG